jgi:5-methyltetrahydrofolate--homocysteine methyltransferase
MNSLLDRLRQGQILVSDGAMGTLLQAKGLVAGDCAESWCVSHPDVVKGIAEAYIAAGADIVETNTFGGSAFKLRLYGMPGRVRELNRAAASLAKEAMGDRGYVAASVGPTGAILEDEGGDAAPALVSEAFAEQITALAEGGVDAICIETMVSLREALLAVKAAKENTRLPIFCTFTFQAGSKGFQTIMGVRPDRAIDEVLSAGADVVGANCGNGIVNMIEIARQLRAAAPSAPILIQANAGLPVVQRGKTMHRETPENMASRIAELIEAGANIVGGCCGTTPAHIAAITAAVRQLRH